ncbi:MAG TPA: trypsin-like peptidase domain-containing protein, partial [Candidatus Limnocylindrales bacterium]|nr:trypsin-like peptidase domain-containing protein [Candidatus Limnocylindrales bacterium]
PPSAVAADLDRLIDASGLPDVIVGLEPLPNPAIELPSDPEVARIGRFAGPSTVQVASVACSARLSGTGFAVARDYVVTNAHVVAGASATRVRAGERTAEAVPVLFDPDLDVALLHVRGLELPPLVLATADPPRGAAGAVLGYPLGEGLTVVPAAVVRSIEALGRDIYDRAPVRRDVLELRARVERGDSGGPFVLPDGTVGGVIFAEARSDPSVGYALSPVEVATAIRPAIGRTREADTGPCLV